MSNKPPKLYGRSPKPPKESLRAIREDLKIRIDVSQNKVKPSVFIDEEYVRKLKDNEEIFDLI